MATVSGGSTSERFRFIQKFGQALGVKYLCDWLNVSPSGFYAWRNRPLSAKVLKDAALLQQIKAVFNANHQMYSSPRGYDKNTDTNEDSRLYATLITNIFYRK